MILCRNPNIDAFVISFENLEKNLNFGLHSVTVIYQIDQLFLLNLAYAHFDNARMRQQNMEKYNYQSNKT